MELRWHCKPTLCWQVFAYLTLELLWDLRFPPSSYLSESKDIQEA